MAEVRYADGAEPYIVVSRGSEFADSFNARFFVEAFPTLLPFGKGGPRQVEERIIYAEEDSESSGLDTEAAALRLVLLRNISLET